MPVDVSTLRASEIVAAAYISRGCPSQREFGCGLVLEDVADDEDWLDRFKGTGILDCQAARLFDFMKEQ